MAAMPIETRIGKTKWKEWLSDLQRETKLAKRKGWPNGGERFLQALGSFVWAVKNTGRGKAPRYPHSHRSNKFVLSVRQIEK